MSTTTTTTTTRDRGDRYGPMEWAQPATESCTLNTYSQKHRCVLGNGAVDVGNNDLIVPLPQIDVTVTSCGALILSCHRERCVV